MGTKSCLRSDGQRHNVRYCLQPENACQRRWQSCLELCCAAPAQHKITGYTEHGCDSYADPCHFPGLHVLMVALLVYILILCKSETWGGHQGKKSHKQESFHKYCLRGAMWMEQAEYQPTQQIQSRLPYISLLFSMI